MSIRPATRADLGRIVEMLADDPLGATREVVSDPVDNAYERAFADIESEGSTMILVAEQDGAIVGCLQLTMVPGLSRRGAKRAFIEGVRVSADHRGSGIGQLLMEDAIGRARAASCSLVQLTTDATRKDAHRFYDRLGFRATHIGYKLEL